MLYLQQKMFVWRLNSNFFKFSCLIQLFALINQQIWSLWTQLNVWLEPPSTTSKVILVGLINNIWLNQPKISNETATCFWLVLPKNVIGTTKPFWLDQPEIFVETTEDFWLAQPKKFFRTYQIINLIKFG